MTLKQMAATKPVNMASANSRQVANVYQSTKSVIVSYQKILYQMKTSTLCRCFLGGKCISPLTLTNRHFYINNSSQEYLYAKVVTCNVEPTENQCFSIFQVIVLAISLLYYYYWLTRTAVICIVFYATCQAPNGRQTKLATDRRDQNRAKRRVNIRLDIHQVARNTTPNECQYCSAGCVM